MFLIIIIVVIVSSTIFILYKTLIEDKIKSDKCKLAIESIIIFAFIPLCFYFITSYVENDQNEEFQNAILNSLSERYLDRDQLDELIWLKHKEIFESSDKDAKEFANNLLNNLDMKKNEFDKLSKHSSVLTSRLYLRWKPFFDFVMMAIDKRVSNLTEEDESIDYIESDMKPIIYDATKEKFGRLPIRRFKIDGEVYFKISIDPGQVRDGFLTKKLAIVFYEKDYQVFEIYFDENIVYLDPDDKKYGGFSYRSDMTDPLEDSRLRSLTIEAINLLVSSAYIHAKE